MEIVHADNKSFTVETNLAEYFMYEGNYGPTRVLNKRENSAIVAQNDEPYPAGLLNDLFEQTKPTTVAFGESTHRSSNEEEQTE